MPKFMTVEDLRNVLEGMPGDAVVVLPSEKDPDELSPLLCTDTGWYSRKEQCYVDDRCEGIKASDSVKAVSLWPVD